MKEVCASQIALWGSHNGGIAARCGRVSPGLAADTEEHRAHVAAEAMPDWRQTLDKCVLSPFPRRVPWLQGRELLSHPASSSGSCSSKPTPATTELHPFFLCLIIPNWKEKNCLANQLASPQLWCPSNPGREGSG